MAGLGWWARRGCALEALRGGGRGDWECGMQSQVCNNWTHACVVWGSSPNKMLDFTYSEIDSPVVCTPMTLDLTSHQAVKRQ